MSLMTQVGLEFIARDRSRSGMASFNRGITNMTRGVLGLVGVGGGLYMMQRGLRGAIAESSRSQETLAKFNTVFRDQAGAAAQWAETFGDSVGRSTQDVEEWMAGLQDTFVPLGIVRDKAADLSKSLVTLAVDVASFNNKADADVIRDFTSALVGNHETVRKYGIIISESAIKQEALNKGMNKTYAQLSDLEKVQFRYSLIQKGTTDAQGDALRTGDSYANQLKRLKANTSELAAELGGPLIDSLSGVMGSINKNSESWKSFFKILGDGTSEILSGFSEIRATINEFEPVYNKMVSERSRVRVGPGGFGGFGAGTMGAPPKRTGNFLPVGRLDISPRGYQRIAEMKAAIQEREQAERELSFVGPPEPKPTTVVDVAAVAVRTNAQILADTREKLASIRAMDDLTRQGKIQNLKAYMAAHADTLAGVTEAEKLLTDEMTAILESRGNAMDNYRAELLEDMESLNLYISERFADTARSIESGLSGAFMNLREKGSNFRSFMVDVFQSIQDSFAKMLADMAARAVMNATIAPLMSGLGNVFGGLLGNMFGGGPAVQAGASNYAPNLSTSYSNAGVAPVIRHSGWVPDGVPSFHSGRGLKSNEQVAVIEKDELLAPAGQIVRSPLGRSAAPSVIINNNTGRQIEQDGPPQFDGEKWVVGLVAKNISQGGSLSKLMRK